LKAIYLLFCFTLLFSFTLTTRPAHAVPKSVIAKSEYLMAEKLFNQGDHSGAIKHALKAKSLLSKSNSRIEYLLTNAYYAQSDYGKAMVSLEEFFNVTPESSSGTEKYNEMVSLYAELEILLQKQVEKEEAIKEKKKKDEATKEIVSSMLSQQMVAVPGGCFKMGTSSFFSAGDDNEKPAHKVCLNSFSIGKYEVTQALWTAVMGSNPSHLSGDDYPVTTVSMGDVQQFLHELNRLTDKHYRLPTEAEWEYAARSGGKKEKYSGGKNPDQVGWYLKNSGDTIHTVGKKTANGLGLYDMSGNVWEWCQDWYSKKYYQNSPVNNPTGPAKGKRYVLRGGAFSTTDSRLRVSSRACNHPNVHQTNHGFRLVHP
jgi:formylglycine-generating enzyme required for sulfatase activity